MKHSKLKIVKVALWPTIKLNSKMKDLLKISKYKWETESLI